jgi:hypothetical protein
VLNLLRHTAQLATGASGTAKQTASHACHTLRQYCRAHLHRRVTLALAAGGAPTVDGGAGEPRSRGKVVSGTTAGLGAAATSGEAAGRRQPAEATAAAAAAAAHVHSTASLLPGHRAVDLGQLATDRNLRVAAHNPNVAAALQRSPWLVMDAFVAQEGHEVWWPRPYVLSPPAQTIDHLKHPGCNILNLVPIVCDVIACFQLKLLL